MTDIERKILSNQNQILAQLVRVLAPEDVDSIEYFEKASEVFESGYSLLYDDYLPFSKEFPKEKCTFVIDILELYSILKYSNDKLGTNKVDPSRIVFYGFDGNNEYDYRGFCLFFVKRMNRFGELLSQENADLNSHYKMVDRYKLMLQRWDGMGRKDKLSKEEIELIIG